ncbi:hypothetical protein DEU56DRAFT_917106 [Suillus clintonianus]|uniref:uncharacterized protein n=1 Tax=Suillus clintonianus TaxID=1904413 RepID=UPI001B85C4A5|nr:uncharacterized protein DEU56DRAFT_917106 [Suillus clintonianus]KAG2124234.1 hypothetical protein DEU56DRAFT_917106 [Suillus clintonianus]
MLIAVDNELELVRKHVPPQVKITSISGDYATQAGALEALRRNTWVHLACHGKWQNHEQPYHSCFIMRDKPVTLLDIMKNDTPQAEFAFLSATGLQFSGFKSIIGTLWEFNDAVAKHVVEAFYENMFQ